jgi:hypothetical protein
VGAAGQSTLGQLGERGECGWVEVFEQIADLVADLLAGPHGVLLGAGQHPDRLGQFCIGGQHSVCTGIGANDVGQQHRVGGVGFGPRHRIPRPVARRRQRVDRVDRPSGRAQRGDPQPAIGFDRDGDRTVRGVAGFSQQRQQLSEAGSVVVDASPHHHTSFSIDHSNVVMFWPSLFRSTGARFHSSCRCSGRCRWTHAAP